MTQYGGSLRKVTLEYDHETRTLVGEEADKWMDAINNRIVFLTYHAGFG